MHGSRKELQAGTVALSKSSSVCHEEAMRAYPATAVACVRDELTGFMPEGIILITAGTAANAV
jgi:hypothetical protein